MVIDGGGCPERQTHKTGKIYRIIDTVHMYDMVMHLWQEFETTG